MNFDRFILDNDCTQEERIELAHHLAGIRYRHTLELIDHPIGRAAKASIRHAKASMLPRCRHKILKGHCPECPSA